MSLVTPQDFRPRGPQAGEQWLLSVAQDRAYSQGWKLRLEGRAMPVVESQRLGWRDADLAIKQNRVKP
jgi:hypothetical protein